eukprot:TRINITY_DN6462_c0_g2_i2.p1 TRINITY_DN6462_c0_g2~~TRINITY_DN6462_c0_g2_i2.p1  ORF type:complete len:343 (+),score=30.00 TRINITY_DN6462_c0_g2_i2:231-1259(+)
MYQLYNNNSQQQQQQQTQLIDDSPFLLSPNCSVIPIQVQNAINGSGTNWSILSDQNTQLFSNIEYNINSGHVGNVTSSTTTYQAIPLVEQYLEYIQPTVHVTSQPMQQLDSKIQRKVAWSPDSSSGDSAGTRDTGASEESKILSSGGQRIVSAAEIGGLSDEDGSMNPQLASPPTFDLSMEDLIQIVSSQPQSNNVKQKQKLPSQGLPQQRMKVVNRRGMSRQTVCQLAHWLCDNILNPYPTRSEKMQLAQRLNVKENQVSNWFVNARTRFWKPLVHQVYIQHKERLMSAAGSDTAALEQLLQCDQTTNAPVLLSLMDPQAKEHLQQKVISTFRSAGFLSLV